LREYGEKRRFDALLVLQGPAGAPGPVFKVFRSILPEAYTNCHGVHRIISDYTPDDAWRRQTDSVRRTLRDDFPRLTLLADSLDFGRTPRAGFDGIAIYNNFFAPRDYAAYAIFASRAGLVFSFNVNPGYDGIDPRQVDPRELLRAFGVRAPGRGHVLDVAVGPRARRFAPAWQDRRVSEGHAPHPGRSRAGQQPSRLLLPRVH
jgi:hypothetical protein